MRSQSIEDSFQTEYEDSVPRAEICFKLVGRGRHKCTFDIHFEGDDLDGILSEAKHWHNKYKGSIVSMTVWGSKYWQVVPGFGQYRTQDYMTWDKAKP